MSTEAELAAIEKEKQNAAQDMADIQELKRVPAFKRYFMRRLQEKRDTVAQRVLEEEMPDEKREQLRQVHIVLKELCEMPRTDEVNAQKLLNP